MTDFDIDPSEKKGISRRTVTKAMAWSVPAIAIAAPVPAFALSGPPPVGTFLAACKLPGGSCHNPYTFQQYGFEVILNNNTNKDIYLYTGITISTDDPNFSLTFDGALASSSPTGVASPITLPYLIPANTTIYLLLRANPTGNSANTVTSGLITLPWGHTPGDHSDTDHTGTPIIAPYASSSTPPLQNDRQCLILLQC